MKKFILTLALSAIVLLPQTAKGAPYAGEAAGYILLQVEANGEAWYVYPVNGNAYYLGRPADAFKIMKTLALGAKHDFIANTDIFPQRLSGLILLDVETDGEAYYVYPGDLKKYYLGRPADAFRVMRELGLGATNADLARLTTAGSAAEKILLNVPFSPQAPLAEWSDMRQEDGCEEAASLMAVKWARGQSLTKQEALKEILGSSAFTLKKYGEYRDITLADTLNWIIKDYFGYSQASLKKDIKVEDIINELKNGHVIITPMNGQLLSNPNYTAPGPIHHMVVIRGYDPVKNVFITNDPGTRNGELYRYSTDVLYTAIRDYPTGYHGTFGQIEKNMIVVSK